MPTVIQQPHYLSTIVDSQIRYTCAESTREQPISFWTRGFRWVRVTLARQAIQTEPPELAALGQVSAKFATFAHRSEYQWRAGQSSEEGEARRNPPISFWTRGFRWARFTLARQAMQTERPALAALGQVSAKFATFAHRSEYQWRAGQTSEQGETRRNPPKADRENLPTAPGTPFHRSYRDAAILASGHVPGLSSRWQQSRKIPTKPETASEKWRAATAFRRNKTETVILPSHNLKSCAEEGDLRNSRQSSQLVELRKARRQTFVAEVWRRRPS